MAAAAAPACVPGTLASYIALGSGGCSIQSVTFATFAYVAKSSGGAPQITPDQIQVNPTFAVPATSGFSFSAKWGVAAGQAQDSIIRYTITGPPTSTGSLQLQLGPFQVGSAGAVAVRESTTVGNLQVFAECAGMCRSKTMDTLQFSPATAGLQVVDHVKLSATNGDTSLASFSAAFDYCPLCV
jgi:hypothetical protein